MNFLDLFSRYGFITLYVIVLTFGFYFRKKYNHNSALRLWLYFIIYSFLSEVIGYYFVQILEIRTTLINNTWFIVSIFFYMLFFLSKIESRLKKNAIKSLVLVYFIFIILSVLFFNNYVNESMTNSFIIGALFIVVTIMLFFTELLKSDVVLYIQKSLFFWISIGVLIFNIGLLPVLIIGELIDWQGIFNYLIIILNIIMAGCFITGFLMSNKEFNS